MNGLEAAAAALFAWLARPVSPTWSRVEVLWSIGAAVGLLLSSWKLGLMLGDLWAALRARANRRRRVIVGAWGVAIALFFAAMFAGFLCIGWLAGQSPPAAPRPDAAPAGAVSGLILVGLEAFAVAAILFSLWARLEADRGA